MADKNRKRDKIFMDLKQLQYIVVCAQTGSFSDAAKNLYSTQPSVSKVIKGLEDTLGMQLFERLPRGIRLTVQGHKMYEYASKIINGAPLHPRGRRGHRFPQCGGGLVL